MFSIMTMASSTTKPTEIASAISDRLSIENPASHMPAQVPASASGTETPAAMVGVSRRRKTNTTSITRNAVASSVHCMSSTLARMVPVRSTSVEISTPAGKPLLQLRQQRPHPVDGVDHVGVALLGDLDQDRRLLVEPGDRAAVADGILDLGDVGEADEIAARALDDDVAEFGRGAHLLVGRDRLALAAAVEDADRPERIGVDDGEPHVVGRDPRIRQRHRIERDPHRRLVGAADGDFADARHLRDALRDHGIGDVVHRAGRQRLRRQRQHEHRRRRRDWPCGSAAATAGRSADRPARR